MGLPSLANKKLYPEKLKWSGSYETTTVCVCVLEGVKEQVKWSPSLRGKFRLKRQERAKELSRYFSYLLNLLVFFLNYTGNFLNQRC